MSKSDKEPDIVEVSKELTIARIEKYGNGGSFYPDPEQVVEAFKVKHTGLKETI